MTGDIMRDFVEVMRDERVIRDSIIDLLRDEPRTVIEIAEALKHPPHEVMIWVATMWRYGAIVETGKPNEEGYFKYQLNQ